MLLDRKKSGIYSLENFAAWLAQQPPEKVYHYTDPTNCAAAQYLKAHGVEAYSAYALTGVDLKELGWYGIVMKGRTSDTFGRASKRAQSVLRRKRIKQFFAGLFSLKQTVGAQ